MSSQIIDVLLKGATEKVADIREDVSKTASDFRERRQAKRKGFVLPRIVVETHAGSDYNWSAVRNFHTNEQLSDMLYTEMDYSHGILKKGFTDRTPAPTAISDLYKALLAVKGVQSISLDKYNVRVTIGNAFKWEHVQPEIIRVLKQHLSWFGAVDLDSNQTYHRPERDFDF